MESEGLPTTDPSRCQSILFLLNSSSSSGPHTQPADGNLPRTARQASEGGIPAWSGSTCGIHTADSSFSMLCSSPAASVKGEAGLTVHPTWALGTEDSVHRECGMAPSSGSNMVVVLCTHIQKHLTGQLPGWAPLILQFIPDHRLSVCSSPLLRTKFWFSGIQPTPTNLYLSTITAEKQGALRPPPLQVVSFVVAQKEASLGREGFHGLAGVCHHPGSQHGGSGGRGGAQSFTRKARDRAP